MIGPAIAILAPVLIAFLVVWLLRSIKRGLVFAALDSAYQNGYFEPDEHLHGASPNEIAYDMTTYALEFESTRPETLTPYVRQWLRHKGLPA